MIKAIESLLQTNLKDLKEQYKTFSFECEINYVPTIEIIQELISLFSKRDTIKITLDYLDDNPLTIHSENVINQEDFHQWTANIELDDLPITLYIEISKNIEKDTLSIYDMTRFSYELLQNDLITILKRVSHMLNGRNKIIWENLSDQEYIFNTDTIFLKNKNTTLHFENIERSKQLQKIKDVSICHNIAEFECIPEDFHINHDYKDNPLTPIFERLCSTLSLMAIAEYSKINQPFLELKFHGTHKNIFSIPMENLTIDEKPYILYSWIFSTNIVLDKITLSRTNISLYNKDNTSLLIDDKIIGTIQSNYNLYLNENVKQYIQLKNDLASYITDITSKTNDIITNIFNNYKLNIFGLMGFLFTIILTNIFSNDTSSILFNFEVSVICETCILFSFIYKFICSKDFKIQLQNLEHNYETLEESYYEIFTEIERNRIFHKTSSLEKNKKNLISSYKKYSKLWTASLLFILLIIEFLSTDSILHKIINFL